MDRIERLIKGFRELKYARGKSFRQISNELGMDVRTARQTFVEAMKKIIRGCRKYDCGVVDVICSLGEEKEVSHET